MLGVRHLSLVTLSLAVCASASAQAAPKRPTATFRSGIDVVALNVTVLDVQQRLIGDLGRQDFAVFEDGVRQEISYFETRDVPLDLALLIDTSVSMQPSLDVVQRAAKSLAAMLRPSDRAAVMAFNDRVHVLTTFTSDASVIAQATSEAADREC